MKNNPEPTKFTPGPYELEFTGGEGHTIKMASRIKSAGYYRSCHCLEWNHSIDPGELDWDEVSATATLFAAAPEMYEALKKVAAKFGDKEQAKLKEWEGSGTECFEDPGWVKAAIAKDFHDIVAEAIAKAETIHPQ